MCRLLAKFIVCFTIAGLLPVLMSVVVPAARLFPSQVSRASSAFTAQSNLLLASAGAYFSRASMSDQPAKHEFLVTYVTVPNAAVAKTISHGLVKGKLAACVNIIANITSVYQWQGKVEEDNESMLVIKSHHSRIKEITEYVEKNHPFDVPEVISMNIVQGSEPYLKWIGSSVKKDDTGDA